MKREIIIQETENEKALAALVKQIYKFVAGGHKELNPWRYSLGVWKDEVEKTLGFDFLDKE